MLSALLPLLLLLGATLAQGYQYPDMRYELLEALLYENAFSTLVAGCPLRDGVGPGSVPAEWLRFAYHDMATHNADQGTGGLDGSLHYEIPENRTENAGRGMMLTQIDFGLFSDMLVSKADVIAMGAIHSVAACGGPIIPFRGGRIDATSAGPEGVPKPEQDLKTHTEKFRLQGFNHTEMISLVACGHTMGGIRGNDFPDIVSNSTKDNIQDFDTPVKVFNQSTFITRVDTFDENVVTTYLNNTTPNPLVVGPNTTRSDFRIFSSDNNVTMHSMSTADAFKERCKVLLGRMLETVPKGVIFTEEIKMIEEKVFDTGLMFVNDKLHLQTNLRLARKAGTAIPPKRTVKVCYCDKASPNCRTTSQGKHCALEGDYSDWRRPVELSPITKLLGFDMTPYHFLAPLPITTPNTTLTNSVSSFWFEVDENDGTPTRTIDNGFRVSQDDVIYSPTLTQDLGHFGAVRLYVIAVKASLKVKAVSLRVFDNTPVPPIPIHDQTLEFKLNSTMPAVAGYNFYTGPPVTRFDDGLHTVFGIKVVFDDGKVVVLDNQATYVVMNQPSIPV